MKRTAAIIIALTTALALSSSCSRKGTQAPTGTGGGVPATGTTGTSPGTTTTGATQGKATTAGVSIAGAPRAGAPAVSAPTTSVPAASAPAAPVKREEPCHLLTFKHKKTAGHGDAETCSGHRNLIPLALAKVNAKSLCVRIDGTPVRYTTSDKGLVIGPLAGPDSVITVRYCTGKAACKENCAVPRDEFLEAIGAEGEGAGGGRVPAAQWDPDDQEKVQDVTQELDGEVIKELADDSDLQLFTGWNREAEAEGCQEKQGA